MKHYLILKLKPEADFDQCLAFTKRSFEKIEKEVPCVKNVKISANSYKRPGNYDLMITFFVSDGIQLEEYIKHPAHLEYANEMIKNIESRCSFDREE